MSGQYMKPKNRNDQRESSELRSKTPLASSTSANSARGLPSGKVMSVGGSADVAASLFACQTFQYPPATSDTPTSAAAASRKSEMRCRVARCGKMLAPKWFSRESDNGDQLASIMPDTFLPNIARSVVACITLSANFTLVHDGASFSR